MKNRRNNWYSQEWVGVALAVMVLIAVPAGATQDDQDRLPVTDPFSCLICHDTMPADGDSSLNLFGDDFLANARVWNAALAALDSDGDGCLNGVELGDADADGVGDGNVDLLQSNPGAGGDCGGATVDAASWGDLKALFDRK